MTRNATELAEEASNAFARAERADFSGVRVLYDALLVESDPASRAWAAALGVPLYLASPMSVSKPDVSALRELAGGTSLARRAALVALPYFAIAGFVRFSGSDLTAARAIVSDMDDLTEPDRATAAVVEAFERCAHGDGSAALEASERAARIATAEKCAGPLVLATSLRALASATTGDFASALSAARRASLMGRTEGLPHVEFFSHLVLARIRRLIGQPYLSLRITSALAGVVTPPWRAWLDWERIFSGDLTNAGAPERVESNASAAVDAAREFFDAARGGRRDAFDRAVRALERSAFEIRPFADEVAELVSAVDPSRTAPSPALDDFRRGVSVLTPPSLNGLRLRPEDESSGETASSYALAPREGTPARLLHFGVPLVSSAEVQRIRQSQRAEGRVEILLSILALAGPNGLDEPRCFAEAYGFAFVVEIHRGVFEVLVHRARAALGDGGAIVRDAGRITLHPARTLVIPDPRTSQRIVDRVLRLLSRKGVSSAKDAAEGLGVSLRAAQGALRTLADDGACKIVRDGRNIAYVVEDTVFSEPTKRLLASEVIGL